MQDLTLSEKITKLPNTPIIPGYPNIKLVKIGPEGNLYLSKNPNAVIKIFYYNDDSYNNDVIQNTIKNHSHFYKLMPDNIPEIYSIINNDEYAAIVMENIESVTLDKYIYDKNHKRHNHTARDILKVTHSLITCVNQLHTIGYVHYDLHLNNILVTNDLSIKLIDFSLSDTIDAVDPSDRTYPKVHLDQLFLKNHISALIFPNLPKDNISNTMKMVKKYTIQDVIGHNTDPIIANCLYNLFQVFSQIECH